MADAAGALAANIGNVPDSESGFAKCFAKCNTRGAQVFFLILGLLISTFDIATDLANAVVLDKHEIEGHDGTPSPTVWKNAMITITGIAVLLYIFEVITLVLSLRLLGKVNDMSSLMESNNTAFLKTISTMLLMILEDFPNAVVWYLAVSQYPSDYFKQQASSITGIAALMGSILSAPWKTGVIIATSVQTIGDRQRLNGGTCDKVTRITLSAMCLSLMCCFVISPLFLLTGISSGT